MKQLRKDRGSFRTEASAPTQGRGDVGQDRLDDMRIVVDTELVGDGEQQRVSLGDGLVALQLLDKDVRLGGIGAAEHGELFRLDVTEMIFALVAAEIRPVAIVHQREDAAADGDPRLADELADHLADRAWAQRHAELPPMRTVSEALEETAKSAQSPWRKLGPVCFVDVDDIVGAGAPGGNTHFVQAFAEDSRGLRGYVPVHDPAAVEAAWAAGERTALGLTLRGTPGYGQPAVELDARVAKLHTSDFGRVARLDVQGRGGGFHVAVSESPPLPIHPRFWRELGLDPREADVIVQKNFFHYRMFYATTSFSHVPVISDGATSLERLRTRAFRVPTFPGTDPGDWRLSDRVLRDATPQRASQRLRS